MEVDVINTQTGSSVNTDSKSNRKTRRERLLPVFVYEILTENTSKYNHCSQEYIRNKLTGSYDVNVDSRTVSRCLSSLLDEELGIFGSSGEGYWYDRKGYYME